MCLTISYASLRRKPKTKTFYKAYHINDINKLRVSGLYYAQNEFSLRKHLTIVSNRTDTTVTDMESISGSISKGIHVLTTPKGINNVDAVPGAFILVQLECEPEDFVAYGDASSYCKGENQAVFTKVRVVDIVRYEAFDSKLKTDVKKRLQDPLPSKVKKVFESGLTIRV